MANEVIERTFPVSEKASLKLSNISGSVTLQRGEANQIYVKATKLQDSGSASRTEIVMEQAEGGQVTVATRFPEGILGFLSFSNPCAVEYQVFLPQNCNVHASGVSSSIDAQEIEGSLEFSTVSGNMLLKALSGSVSATTVSGELNGSEISAVLFLKTVSGNIRLSGSFSSVDSSTVSGGIHLDTAILGNGPYNFKSVSGDINLELFSEAAFRLEHRSVSGSIHTNLPVTRSSKQPGSHRVEIGTDGPLISSNSVSGNLNVTGPGGETHAVEAEDTVSQSPTPSQPVPPAPPPPPSTPPPANGLSAEARQELLEKIAAGEISVDEAIDKLKSH